MQQDLTESNNLTSNVLTYNIEDMSKQLLPYHKVYKTFRLIMDPLCIHRFEKNHEKSERNTLRNATGNLNYISYKTARRFESSPKK